MCYNPLLTLINPYYPLINHNYNHLQEVSHRVNKLQDEYDSTIERTKGIQNELHEYKVLHISLRHIYIYKHKHIMLCILILSKIIILYYNIRYAYSTHICNVA